MKRVIASANVLVLLACGGVTGSSTSSSADGGLSIPPKHRTTHAVCSATRAGATPPDPDAATSPIPPQCTTDAQCNDSKLGRNGRCELEPSCGGGCPLWIQCTYDECATDADCGPKGVCECGTGPDAAGNPRAPHRCNMGGDCQVDADCGGGEFCVQDDRAYCAEHAYHCTSAADECRGGPCPSTAAGASAACVFNKTKSHWACEVVNGCDR